MAPSTNEEPAAEHTQRAGTDKDGSALGKHRDRSGCQEETSLNAVVHPDAGDLACVVDGRRRISAGSARVLPW